MPSSNTFESETEMHLFQPFFLQQHTALHLRRTTPIGLDRRCSPTLAKVSRDYQIKMGLIEVPGDCNDGLLWIVVCLDIVQQILTSQLFDRLFPT